MAPVEVPPKPLIPKPAPPAEPKSVPPLRVSVNRLKRSKRWVLWRQLIVDSLIPLVVIEKASAARRVVTRGQRSKVAGLIRRIRLQQLKQCESRRRKSRRRYYLAWERAGQWLDRRSRDFQRPAIALAYSLKSQPGTPLTVGRRTEASTDQVGRWNCHDGRRANLLTDALVVPEKEEPVLQDRATDRSAELVKQRLGNEPAGDRIGAELGIRVASQLSGALTVVETRSRESYWTLTWFARSPPRRQPCRIRRRNSGLLSGLR